MGAHVTLFDIVVDELWTAISHKQERSSLIKKPSIAATTH
jgi:hypothetical protein